ncbi:MAG: acyl-CoA thioesterase [Planctomycetota bacterium]|jgi:acyl-CoA thioester hydrolase
MPAHRHRFRVRYGESDQMGVVHHAAYVLYFEEGRTLMMRDLGMPYSEMEASGVILPVVDMGIRFRTPAKYDEELVTETTVVEVTGVRMRFEYRVLHDDDSVAAEGYTVLASVGEDGRPRRLPKDVLSVLRSAIPDEGLFAGVQEKDPGRTAP